MENSFFDTYFSLDEPVKLSLRNKFRDAPRARRLLDFFEQHAHKKFRTPEIVDYIYPEKEPYTTRRNRYFKLRKHVFDQLLADPERLPAAGSSNLLPYEYQLFDARQLISENRYGEARHKLSELIRNAERDNIFELLPEMYSQLIYAKMALNQISDLKPVIDKMALASTLHYDLRKAQVLARQIYVANISRHFEQSGKLLAQLERLAVRRKKWPRFRLFYLFVAMNYTVAMPIFDTGKKQRLIRKLKNERARHPDIPASYYEPAWKELLAYYIATAEGTLYYLRLDLVRSYSCYRNAWKIMDNTAFLRVRKSESHYSNKLTIETLSGNYTEALKTAKALLEFQQGQKKGVARFKAYLQMASIYTYAYPVLECPDKTFLADRLHEFVALLKKQKDPEYPVVLANYAVFMFLCGQWKKAAATVRLPECKAIFKNVGIENYIELLRMNPDTPREKLENLLARNREDLKNYRTTEAYYGLQRLERLAGMLLAEMK